VQEKKSAPSLEDRAGGDWRPYRLTTGFTAPRQMNGTQNWADQMRGREADARRCENRQRDGGLE
jgi:hypothetical protein